MVRAKEKMLAVKREGFRWEEELVLYLPTHHRTKDGRIRRQPPEVSNLERKAIFTWETEGLIISGTNSSLQGPWGQSSGSTLPWLTPPELRLLQCEVNSFYQVSPDENPVPEKGLSYMKRRMKTMDIASTRH